MKAHNPNAKQVYEHTAVHLDSEREKLNTEVSAYNEVSRKPKQIQTKFPVEFRVWSQGWEEYAREISSLTAQHRGFPPTTRSLANPNKFKPHKFERI